ncbi:hypothetical protein L195_g001958 [Trifolium pratense]|uniref:Uncharacterized protein n=1 Tax=Trifolium pratense TaxID=57577 RepID=A0A2K3NR44_TRIPR|nr:hypothetical protein L195_g001958 [Trifolium pratense]
METPMAPIIRSLKMLLVRGGSHLLRNIESFSSLVDDLRDYSWRLSRSEAHFLRALLCLRDELVASAPIIASVDGAEARYQKTRVALFDQARSVEENMRMLETSLSAYFHDEDACDARISELRTELTALEERKLDIQNGVREDIGNLLEHRRIQLELKSQVASLGGALERLMNNRGMARTCKLDINKMCEEAEDAAKYL